MTFSTQVTSTDIFSFMAVIFLSYGAIFLSYGVLFISRKRFKKLLKSRLFFREIANFTGKLLQNYN